MSNYTPGPWTVENGGDILGPLGGDSGDGCKCDHDDGWQVAEVDVYSSFVGGKLVELGSGPRAANARLIAAAPELLEALDLMVSTATDGGWPTASIVIAQAAIAKARGATNAEV